MERKLASIQAIDHLAPIPGADRIEQARVMGWSVVVKKGEFAVGDRCVFFEIDSVLPDGPAWAEFLRPRKFRIKTAKLRGVLSQGLALPVSILAGPVPPVGSDLREALGVTKYEVVLPDTREIAGPFPAGVPKTDEIRLQSALGILDEIRGLDFHVTTKLDGTSVTFYRPPEEESLIVCSRNFALAQSESHPWRMEEKYDLSSKLPPGYAAQGEICGPGIQKNRLGLNEVGVFFFNVWDLNAGRFLDFQQFHDFCTEHALPTVPVEEVVQGEAARSYVHTLDVWLERAKGNYPRTKQRKEGIVVRPLAECHSPTLGGRLSFKVINNDFLLQDEE